MLTLRETLKTTPKRLKLEVEERDLEEYEQYLAKTLGLGC